MRDPRPLVEYTDRYDMARQQRRSLGRIAAVVSAWRAAMQPLYDSLGAFRTTYRLARERGHSIRGRPMPLPDVAAAYSDTELSQDEAEIVLYKDSTGQLFTPSMMSRLNAMDDAQIAAERKAGRYVPNRGASVLAYECSDERAEELIGQLEYIELEHGLTENDQRLLKTLRKKLEERYA